MPDVIVRGMKMPVNCESCPFCDYEFANCLASAERNTLPYNGERRDWCPLAPVSDDLIEADGDAFIDALLTSYENQRWIPADKPPKLGESVILRAGALVGEGYYTSAHTWRRITGMPMRVLTDEPVTEWMPLPEAPE